MIASLAKFKMISRTEGVIKFLLYFEFMKIQALGKTLRWGKLKYQFKIF